MMKPNFKIMSIPELKAYLLENRNDGEAIHAIIEKIHLNPNTQRYSAEDADRLPEIYEEHRKRRGA
ncbi:hypothetical protein GS601_01380 [Myxacorys almedinensis A]|uniref:Uncharacterized protein n=2 Tax=Myxacorys TaxID=2056239 RepID=A0A8J8CJV4_9CYAN|nr:hypothetical protein [Myxacorys almedinensis A]